MDRRLGLLSLLLAALAAVGVRLLSRVDVTPVLGVSVDPAVRTLLSAAAVAFAAYGVYVVVTDALLARTESKRRRHDVRNFLRLGFGAVAAVGVFGALTEQWLSVLLSLGIVGSAVTFALQQPRFSLAGGCTSPSPARTPSATGSPSTTPRATWSPWGCS